MESPFGTIYLNDTDIRTIIEAAQLDGTLGGVLPVFPETLSVFLPLFLLFFQYVFLYSPVISH